MSNNTQPSSKPWPNAVPSVPRRQDYILRTRYHNPLPIPPFQSKFLDNSFSPIDFTGASMLSNLTHQRMETMNIEEFVGLPVDLSNYYNFFVPGNTTQRNVSSDLELAASKLNGSDQALIKSSKSNILEVGAVSFLRRTEYISNESAHNTLKPQIGKLRNRPDVFREAEQRGIQLGSTENQADTIEKYFMSAHHANLKIEHPTKKSVNAVKSIPILPNFEAISSTRLMLKFPIETKVGSNFDQNKCLFLPCVSNLTGEEYFKRFETIEPPGQSIEVIKYKFAGNYEGRLVTYKMLYEDLGLVEKKIGDHKILAYFGISAKCRLKRKRIEKESQPEDVGEIELQLRPLNEDETVQKKQAVLQIDPYSISEN